MSASDLDLSKASDAIQEMAETFTSLDGSECTLLARAALPHIIDALVDWFETEDPETLNGDDREFGCVAVYLQAIKQELGA